jgi:hypothetical protein
MDIKILRGNIHLTGAPGEENQGFAVRLWQSVSTGARYHGRYRRWVIPLSHDAIDGLKAMGVAMPPEASAWLADQQKLALARVAANKIRATPASELRTRLTAIGVRLPPTAKDHQVVSAAYALKLPACGLFLDTGTGKTATAAIIMQALVDLKGYKRFLVMAPKTILGVSWGADVSAFSDLRWVNISDPPPREPVLTCPVCKRVFKTHVGWRHMRTHMSKKIEELGDEAAEAELYRRHPELQPPGADDKRQRLLTALSSDAQVFLINPEAFKLVADDLGRWDWDMFIVDESSCLKNPKSQITQMTISFGASVRRRVCMTATPRPNTSLDFWGQMAFLDQCLGGNFYAFRSKYYYQTSDGFRWLPKTDDTDMKIRDIVFERSIRYQLDECVDLPGECYELAEVELDGVLKTHYRDMHRKMMLEFGNGETVSTSWLIVQMNKLSQITSGFVFDDAGNSRFLGESPKIAETVRIARQLIEDEGRSVVIWIRFPETEGKLIGDALAKYGVSTMHGGTSDHEASAMAFKTGRNKVMIAHPLSAKFGHTWVEHCNVAIFHSYGYSFEDFYQAKRRIYRMGQTRKVTYVTVVAKGTVDEVILKAVMTKQEAHEAVVDGNVIAQLLQLSKSGRR